MGFLLFIIYKISSNYIDRKNSEILVDANQINLLTASFEKRSNRTPDKDELQTLIESHIKDEVFYREAVAMGLDKSDPAIKRRLRQIIELMLDDYSDVYPSENQLLEYLSVHSEKFIQDPTISFVHRFFAMDKKQEAMEELSKLQEGTDSEISQNQGLNLIPDEFENVSQQEVRSTFGQIFSNDIFEMSTDSWQGPVASAYGWHLVYVSQRIEGEIPPLSEIWDVVEREWTLERKQKMKEAQFEKMKERYDVVVELPNNENK